MGDARSTPRAPAPSRVPSLTLCAGLCLCLLLPTVSAAAQGRAVPEEAVEFYRSGREHYQAGRYREAADDLERAMQLDPSSPTLAFNLGKVYELLGELPRAIDYFSRYLSLLPPEDEENAARAREIIGRLEGALSNQEVDAPPPPPPEAPPDEDEAEMPRYVTSRGVADTPFWVTLGAGGTLLITGAVLGGVALGRKNEADGFVLGLDGTWEQRQSLFDEAESLALGADILMAAGALGMVAAGLLYVLRTTTVELLPEGTAVSVGTDGRGAALLLSGAF